MLQKLTKAEEEVMQLYWERGEATVSDLISELPEPKPPHSTISTITRILESKGFLDHKAYGRSFVYFPVVLREDYTKFSIKSIVTNYFQGSMNDLVSFLLKENDLSLKDLDAIKSQFEDE